MKFVCMPSFDESLVPNDYIDHLKSVSESGSYDFDESSINLPFDENLIKSVIKLKESLSSSTLRYVLVVGIGGSNLGTKAVYDALFGYYDVIEDSRFPKIIFLDTNDSTFLNKIHKLLFSLSSPEEIIINVISKSGKTTETIANMEFILQFAPNLKERIVVTTDEGSPLWELSEKMSFEKLSTPAKVGGRFSVFSSVSLFPLACAGIDILSLLEGAMEARSVGLKDSAKGNLPLKSALALDGSKMSIHDTFLFSPSLESLGKWYRQLMAESLGKDGKGITPTVSIGSSDLHSVEQLYLGGPKDKIFTLVFPGKVGVGTKDPFRVKGALELIPEIKGKSPADIIKAVFEGTKSAFKENNIPFMEIHLDGINEKELGFFMQFKMLEIMFLGKLTGVNTFDQPNVEEYKKVTRSILQES